MFVCQVIVDIPLRQSFHYLSEIELRIGQQVIVKFRNKFRVGFILDCIASHDFTNFPLNKLNSIESINLACSIDNHLLKLIQFISSYYHHPLASTLFTILPSYYKQINYIAPTPKQKVFYQVNTTQSVATIRSIKQRDIVAFIGNNVVAADDLIIQFGSSVKSNLQKLINMGILAQVQNIDVAIQINKLMLNAEQLIIYQSILSKLAEFYPVLLYGVTGSGKTEVFMHVIEQVLASGKQALILIPEINLTPQSLSWFSSRFVHANIVALNSEITNKQRFDIWHSAQLGLINVIIGTRLSVFTPFKDLGIIIVDEEHDGSFKQNDGLRYHARDLAIWRAKQLQIPILLASATPSMESLYNYKMAKYTLYKLANRAVDGASLPTVQIINTLQHQLNYAGICDLSCNKLADNLAKKELSLVFINRRGYAPIITCYDCGWVSSCRNCSSNMVYHHDKNHLRCHHCGYQIAIPKHCPSCSNQYLHTIGHGTQKLEEFLQLQFPTARIARVDRDTTTNKQAWVDLYEQINAGNIDILIGTQMLAKGHNFANLTLVIGLNLDNALFSYDFRASENMFHVLTQVSGRAGRTQKKGMVLLQTNYPDHPIYKFICQHDINGFIEYTQQQRKNSNLPPYSFLVIIRLSSTVENKLQRGLRELSKLAKAIEHKYVEVFPAIPAVMYKAHNRFRGQMLISSNNRHALHNYLNLLEQQLTTISYVSIAIDVDPLDV